MLVFLGWVLDDGIATDRYQSGRVLTTDRLCADEVGRSKATHLEVHCLEHGDRAEVLGQVVRRDRRGAERQVNLPSPGWLAGRG